MSYPKDISAGCQHTTHASSPPVHLETQYPSYQYLNSYFVDPDKLIIKIIWKVMNSITFNHHFRSSEDQNSSPHACTASNSNAEPSPNALHPIFWDRASHRTWSQSMFPLSARVTDKPWLCLAFTCILGFQTQVLMLTLELYPLIICKYFNIYVNGYQICYDNFDHILHLYKFSVFIPPSPVEPLFSTIHPTVFMYSSCVWSTEFN